MASPVTAFIPKRDAARVASWRHIPWRYSLPALPWFTAMWWLLALGRNSVDTRYAGAALIAGVAGAGVTVAFLVRVYRREHARAAPDPQPNLPTTAPHRSLPVPVLVLLPLLACTTILPFLMRFVDPARSLIAAGAGGGVAIGIVAAVGVMRWTEARSGARLVFVGGVPDDVEQPGPPLDLAATARRMMVGQPPTAAERRALKAMNVRERAPIIPLRRTVGGP